MRALAAFLVRQLRARPLAVFALCFLAGCMLARAVRLPMGVILAADAGLLAAALGIRRRYRHIAMLLMLAVAVLSGGLRLTLALDAVPRVNHTVYSVPMVGRVVTDPFTNPDTGRVISRFQLETVNGEPSRLSVRLYLRGDAESLQRIGYGQKLSLTGHIWANDPVTNPYEFDFAAYLRRNSMSAMATAKIEDVEILSSLPDLRSPFIAARHLLSDRIGSLFPDNASLARALLLGDRSQLSEDFRRSLNETGTAHLICISGLHVTVLAGALALLLSRFTSRRGAGAIAALCLIPYGAVIGFTPSFVRALVMFMILSCAPLAGAPSDGVTRLCAALLFHLLVQPLAVEDAGFVLSYSATAGLILLTPPLQRLLRVDCVQARIPRHSPPHRALGWRVLLFFAGVLCASLAAQLASLPGVVAFFGVQPLLSLPLNLLCVPICMLGYLLSVAATAFSFLCIPLGRIIALPADGLYTLLIRITRLSAGLPVSGVHIGRYPFLLLLLHAGVAVAASDLSALRVRVRNALPLALILVAALSSLVAFARSWDFRITFLDVDQGDGAVITTRGHTWMIDAGDTYSPAADYLNATCLRLDGVFLSHPHQDHAGGLSDILTTFHPGVIYLPAGWRNAEITSAAVQDVLDCAKELGIPILELAAGDTVALSADTEMTVYAPMPGATCDSVNNLSILALVTHAGHTALFTGDLEESGEPGIIPDTEVLKVAHHGAEDATSQRFLKACTPELAVISVGENSFDHPAEATLARLSEAGARTLLTRDCGAITLTLVGDQWRVKTYLEASP